MNCQTLCIFIIHSPFILNESFYFLQTNITQVATFFYFLAEESVYFVRCKSFGARDPLCSSNKLKTKKERIERKKEDSPFLHYHFFLHPFCFLLFFKVDSFNISCSMPSFLLVRPFHTFFRSLLLDSRIPLITGLRSYSFS